MNITITGKHLQLTDGLRQHIQGSLEGVMTKFFSTPINASVVFTHESDHTTRSDISVHVGRGISVRGYAQAELPAAAYELAFEKLETQLRRYKNRLRSHHKHHHNGAEEGMHLITQYVIDHQDESHDEKDQPVTIAEVETPLLTLSVSEGIMHLELNENPVVVFYNRDTKRLNVVYRRADGNIGWIDPAISPHA